MVKHVKGLQNEGIDLKTDASVKLHWFKYQPSSRQDTNNEKIYTRNKIIYPKYD